MKTAIATVCLSGMLSDKLAAIAAAGFTAVELFENDVLAFPGTPADLRKLCVDLGLKVITFQPFRDFEGMPGARRERNFDRAERKFDLMQEIGCDLMLVCSNVLADALGGIDRLAADFTELGRRAARRGMRVGYEALAWGRYINDYRDAWEVVRRADHPAIGTILDTFHIFARNTDLTAIRAIPRDKIFLVQLADAPRMQMDVLLYGRHWRCMPGQGDFELVEFMQALGDTGYDGYLSLEIFNDRFRAASARAVALDGRRSLISLFDETQRRSGRPVPGAHAMPPPQPVLAVEFVEFAIDRKERAEFEALLAALGFSLAGRHRTKDVALWQQGRIRIVLNSDPSGFAHSYYITHGASVCAIALRVADAAAIGARADALLDVPHAAPVAPGELQIPAVRGLGGSLVYFVDGGTALGRWSEIDFAPVPAQEAAVAGLAVVDHISQSMQYEEMLTWLLFYSSLLQSAKTPSQAVVDPGGVVQSQVIESGLDTGDGGLRLVLNGSQSHRTLSAKFVNEFFGSGVQHIALATEDIFATARHLAKSGVTLLEIPANYYDDLAARFDLPGEIIAAMKAGNILYDCDDRGAYFQIYTATLASGFFFEIVERRNYRGYGAPNAAIRLAAQTRLMRPAGMPNI